MTALHDRVARRAGASELMITPAGVAEIDRLLREESRGPQAAEGGRANPHALLAWLAPRAAVGVALFFLLGWLPFALAGAR